MHEGIFMEPEDSLGLKYSQKPEIQHSWASWIQFKTSWYIYEIKFNIILPSVSNSSKWSNALMFYLDDKISLPPVPLTLI
jgi:hypothetical protein